jgi:IS605 OrfB family transposase
VVESRRACAALDAERLSDKLGAKRDQLAAITQKLDADTKARADHAAAVAKYAVKQAAKHQAKVSAKPSTSPKPPPLPTKAQASKMLDEARHAQLLFEAEGKRVSITALTAKRDAAQAIASGRVDPSIVFGGKALFQARNRIHPNDAQSLDAWRQAWDDARSAGFMLMGGMDEAAGNKSCKMLLEVKAPNATASNAADGTPPAPTTTPATTPLGSVDHTNTSTVQGAALPSQTSNPTVALHLRLPGALVQDPSSPLHKHLHIAGVALPAFGRDTLLDAIRRNAGPVARRPKEGPDSGLALTYRFVRDAGFKHKTLSAWRVCITVEEALPEIRPGMARASGMKAPKRPRNVWTDDPEHTFQEGVPNQDGVPNLYQPSLGKRLGVDVNADCIALALVSADGNLLRTWTLPLHLQGLTSGQREARIGDVVKTVVDLAVAHNARLVLEKLDFAAKKREMGMEVARSTGEASYRRMLSSLAYAAIGNAIERRAARHGVSCGFVNPAYTSLIGEINWMRRVGHQALTRHEAAACAIARRDAGFSERINTIHGRRGRRTSVPTPGEARKHVWRQWSRVHRERLAAAKATRKEQETMEATATGNGRSARHPSPSAHPPGRGEGRRAPRAKSNPGPVGGAPTPVALGDTVQVPQRA